MPILDSLRRLLNQQAGTETATLSQAAPPRAVPELEPIVVPEISASELMRESQMHTPWLLDCREHYERRQGYIAGSAHIPMRELPLRLNALDRDADIVVYCAHGHRSYDVAGWLIGQGFRARSLRGGIAAWQVQDGPITHEG